MDNKTNTFSSLLANYKQVYNSDKLKDNTQAIDQDRDKNRAFRRIRRRLKQNKKDMGL